MARWRRWHGVGIVTILTEILDRSANQSATRMVQTTTQSATRLTQTATRAALPEGLRTVAVLISDLAARERVMTALREEGLSARIVATSNFTVRGLAGPPAALLVYDFAPWTDTARAFLRRLRGFPTALPDLPVLLYVPQRMEIGQLLVEAGRLSMTWGELQFDGPDEVRRLRRAIRQILEVTPAAIVFRMLMFYVPDLPADVVHFCRRACGALAAGRGRTLTVSALSKDLGVERRTLERRWRLLHLAPKEFLDWITLVFAAHIAERHDLEIYDAGELLGMDAKRVERCRLRLKPLFNTDSVEAVLMAMTRRLTQIRVPRPRPATDFRGEVPLFEVAGR